MADSNIVSSLIGVIGAALAAAIPVYFRWVKQRNIQLYKLAYVEVVHLAGPDDAPVYTVSVPRLGPGSSDVDVRDEVHLFRLNVFPDKRSGFHTRDRTSGTVDLLMLHPFKDKLSFTDRGAATVPGVLQQTLEDSTSVVFTKANYYNGLSSGHQDFGVKMECDTVEARLIVDFSSLPDRARVCSPRGSLVRGPREEAKGVVEIRPSVYSLEAHDLKEDDVLRFDFALVAADANRAMQ
jgi:hypothetical protein